MASDLLATPGTCREVSNDQSSFADVVVRGVLHIYAAFDWGDEVRLETARQLVPAELHTLRRKSRTPPSIGYRPPPLRIPLAPLTVPLPILGPAAAQADVTVFDFGAVSTAVHVPFQADVKSLPAAASGLADCTAILGDIRRGTEPLFEKLCPSIENPFWSDLSEEYFVFQILPHTLPPVQTLLEQECEWLAALVRLEAERLSATEITEALRMRLSYGQQDLFLADWAAALIIDDDCEEVLDVIAFANLQLLELRHIDSRIDKRLEETYSLIHQLARGSLPFWRTHTRPLRALGELKVEANVMLERSSNTLKLVGEPYLSRAYQLLGTRFHLDEWGQNIRRSISVLEGIYQVVIDQASAFRMEILEIIIMLLIVVELALAIARH